MASVISFRVEMNLIVNLLVKLGLYLSYKCRCCSTGRFCYQFYLYVLLLIFTGKINLVVIKEQYKEGNIGKSIIKVTIAY